ncbi:MAG: CHAD domain-containing protein [Akkermansiaceae bacterium]|nr:CHAD domain-containing protein [Verrucomicrobiales bacterium]
MKSEMPLRLAVHLAQSVRDSRRRYRRRLARCQKKSSGKAVHDLRVETRRLLAVLGILGAFGYPEPLDKLCQRFKKRLKWFGELRDAQVQLQLLQPLWPKFPEAHSLNTFLQRREARLAAGLKTRVKSAKSAGLNRRLKEVEKHLAAVGKPSGSVIAVASSALQLEFAELQKLRSTVQPADMETIHQFRIGLKRFRYLCELLQPVLPRITEARLDRLKEFQAAAGTVQDLEVLLFRLAQAVKQRKLNPVAIRNLRVELLARKKRAVDSVLTRLDEISKFEIVFQPAPVKPPAQQP